MKHSTFAFAVVAICAVAFTGIAHAKAEKEKDLPPGLQKKYARTGELPPGWQKKLAVGQPLDIHVYREAHVVVPLDRHGMITVTVEGRVIRLIEATREIVEILK